ncbi:MAG TPA: RNA-binding protein [Devosiaceae bacterium]|nr:RNA-binding protein [Devosiaceae bacterium]
MPRSVPPMRQCCVTRRSLPADELVRFALGPDGTLAPDVDARAPGRGAWVSLDAATVSRAVSGGAFARALKAPVTVPPDLAEQTRVHLENRLAGALGMARKAGQLVVGATRVEAALRAGEAVALITASDARPDGRRKLVAAGRAAGLGGVAHIEALSSARLGLALGGENVIHAALTAGAAAQSALAKHQRLARYGARSTTKDDVTV